MIPQALLVVFCIAETLSFSTTGEYYDIQRSSRALATKTRRFEQGQQGSGMFPMRCMAECNQSPACRAVNVFTNGTCELLLSPMIGVNVSAESSTYIKYHKTCPNTFGDALVSSAAHGSCYKIVRENMKWQEARDYCVSLGGDLVAIEDDAELNHLGNLVRDKSLLDKWFWSSGTDEDVEGEWRWASTGAPVNGRLPGRYAVKDGNTQNCLYIYWSTTDSGWEDGYCTWSRYPLCEITLG